MGERCHRDAAQHLQGIGFPDSSISKAFFLHFRQALPTLLSPFPPGAVAELRAATYWQSSIRCEPVLCTGTTPHTEFSPFGDNVSIKAQWQDRSTCLYLGRGHSSFHRHETHRSGPGHSSFFENILLEGYGKTGTEVEPGCEDLSGTYLDQRGAGTLQAVLIASGFLLHRVGWNGSFVPEHEYGRIHFEGCQKSFNRIHQ